MIKLRFDEPRYAITEEPETHVIRVICKLTSTIIDTINNEVIARLNHSGIAKCQPEDHFDKKYGNDLALSRAKAANYYNAMGIISPIAEDSISAVQFMCEMSINFMHEKNHLAWLKNEEEPFDWIPDRREFIVANLEGRLPLLKGDDGVTITDVENLLIK